jgi:NAD-dependent dihydropyrimidine dehydrogenase PreA subunit
LFDGKRRKAKTDEDKCVGCAFCPGVCPVHGCLEMVEK